ncbi:MAG: class I SAM-dependent methyltransferase [Candidatus Binatus sp.]
MTDFNYVGTELELFATAHNWKSYLSRRIRPFVAGEVLEVGAGIGANTPFLDRGVSPRWLCLEPDRLMAARLRLNLKQANAPRAYEVVCGPLQCLKARPQFDTVVYIDVLEHIEHDREELNAAAILLRAGGRLIVLSPAHQWLFSPFDAAIGHHRRYDRRMLRSISPAGLRLEQLWYLDSVGLLLSFANRQFLRQSVPTNAQIRFWDRYVVPASRVLDRCLFGSAGKSIVGIWRREPG